MRKEAAGTECRIAAASVSSARMLSCLVMSCVMLCMMVCVCVSVEKHEESESCFGPDSKRCPDEMSSMPWFICTTCLLRICVLTFGPSSKFWAELWQVASFPSSPPWKKSSRTSHVSTNGYPLTPGVVCGSRTRPTRRNWKRL